MAKAADSPIGFRPSPKGPESSLPPLPDICLTELHTWQACPAGLIAAHVANLVATVEELKSLAASPNGLRLLTAELPGLEWTGTELLDLISRLHSSQEVAA